METISETQNISLWNTIKDKYWNNSSEQRINRKQFLARWILLLIVWLLISYLVWFLTPELSFDDTMKLGFWLKISSPLFAISSIIWIMVYYPFYRMFKTLYIKRYADFNNNGKSPRVLMPIIFYGTVITLLLQIIQAYAWSSVLSSWFFWLWEYTLFIIYGSTQLMLGAFICIFLMFIISLFTSGTKWDNQYGKDPEWNSII